MNETVIKEIKSIYSSKIRNNNTKSVNPDIKSITSETSENQTFFNGVIEKLNIVVSKEE